MRRGPHATGSSLCARLGAACCCVFITLDAHAEDELRPLGAGAVVELSLDVAPAQSIVLRVEQFGIDSVFDVRTGADSYTVDYPSEWTNPEWLLLEAGHHEVTIRSKLSDAAAGQVRVSAAQEHVSDAARSPDEIELLRELTAGARASAAQEWEQALAHFQSASHLTAGRADVQEAVAVLETSVAAWASGQADVAVRSAQRALDIWSPDGPSIELAAAGNMTGLALISLGRNDEARAAFERAFAQDLGGSDKVRRLMTEVQIRGNICFSYLDQRALEPAEPCLLKQLELASACAACKDGVPSILNNLGGLYYMKGGQSLEAVSYFRKALGLLQESDKQYIAEAYNNIGLAYESSGRLREALDNYMQADLLLRDQGLSARYARILGNIGALYLVAGDPYGAQPYLERSLEMMDRMQDATARPTILRDLGVARRSQGNARASLELHRRALNDASQGEDASAIARMHEELSKDYVELGNLDAALREVELADGLIGNSGDAFRRASVKQQQARVDILRNEAQSALEILPRLLDEYKRLESWPGIAATYVAQADALTLLSRKQQAIEMLHSAMDALDSVALHLQSLSLGPDFSSQRHRVFEKLIALTAENRTDSREIVAETLGYSEQAHAMTLRYALSRATGSRQGTSKEATRTLLQEYANKLSDYLLVSVDGLDAGKEQALSIDLRDLQHRIEGLEAGAPQPMRTAIVTQSDLAAILGADTVAVEYMLGESKSYAWWLTDTEMTLVELPARSQIARLVADALPPADPTRNIAPPGAVEALSRAVLEPLSRYRNKQRLAVIADGVLTSIPFGQLVDPGATDPQRDVIDQYEVVHLPSLLTTSLWTSKQEEKAELDVAIFADPNFQTSKAGATWTALPRTRAEAALIASIFPDGMTRQWLGANASLQTLLSPSLPVARILHFATHGVVVPGSPQLTGLVLSQLNAQGTPVPSFLGADMVPYLRLHAAPLVVLSGCETAGGRLTEGEGLVSLAQAFLYAGHRGVIASAWQVPDVATDRLMGDIYRALAEGGITPAQALRRAQLGLRNDRRSFMQSAWRAFAYFGDWRLVPFTKAALRETADQPQ